MLAVFDIGNTNIVLGLYLGSELKAHWRFRTESKMTADELGHFILGLLERRGVLAVDIQDICIASVVTELEFTFEQFCSSCFGRKPLWVPKDLKVNMPVLVDKPETLGADRLVTSYMAWQKYRCALVLIDMGTGTTLEAISADGAYLGGAIAPGFEIAAEALFNGASKLSRVPLVNPASVLGKNTEEQIQVGLVRGYAALIDGLTVQMQSELENPSRVIATGGLAPLMKQASKKIEKVEPHLILEGLCLLYQEYQRGTRNSLVPNRFERTLGYQAA
ncbi:MAG: type III pantothenate kinase [Deltaproteobacteria bacterium]|nr:type III pantothenate kinase [Deltaproteobacteria bacterium]